IIDHGTAKKKLQDMNLIDDFLFTSMMSYPEVCERFSQLLVKIILDYDIKSVRVTSQKVFYGSNTNTHGARLDVYIEEDTSELEVSDESLFDIETEKNCDKLMVKALPKRVRFYHSKIDNISLASGSGYEELKKVYVILIMPFDPFGENHMIYTIQSRCVELPDMPYDDGVRTIFLYTRGKLGNIPQQLRELLQYMEESDEKNAANDELKEIHRMVDRVKRDEEVSKQYMKIYEKEQMLLRQGREEGKEEGREEGRENMLIELVNDGTLSVKVAAAKLHMTEEQFRAKMTN
ncbi:MAG: Rpn family recombination-promoting nuclease/putative transposase, partial [Lachnospiraceae bacterium]